MSSRAALSDLSLERPNVFVAKMGQCSVLPQARCEE